MPDPAAENPLPQPTSAAAIPTPRPVETPVPAPALNLQPCAACNRQVSPKAASCPNCGHPVAPADPWKTVGRASRVVFVAVGLLALGAQTVLLKLLNGKTVGAEDLLPIFLQIAPFTIAVAIVAFAAMRADDWGPVCLLAVIALLTSVTISNYLGHPKFELKDGEGGTLGILYQPLKYYWKIYGPSLFGSSLILGGFLAWSANKLWPLPSAASVPNNGTGS